MNTFCKNKAYAIGLMALFLSLSTGSVVFAGSAHLTWNANSESDLAGYTIYYDTSSHSGGTCPDDYGIGASHVINAGNVTSYWIDTLTPGQTYYFQLTAKDTTGNESGCSVDGSGNPNEVSKLITYRSDIDNNHKVNIFDFNTLAGNWGQTGAGNAADITRNNVVDSGDFTVMRGEFGGCFGTGNCD